MKAKRTTSSFALLALCGILLSTGPARVVAAGCQPANGPGWLRDPNDNGSTWSCEVVYYHGNFGTAGYSQPDAWVPGNKPNGDNCSRARAQVVTHVGSTLYTGSAVDDTSWGNGAQNTSAIGGGYYLFGTNTWEIRDGVWSLPDQTTAFGC